MHVPIGATPPPSALARAMMSGSTPSWSTPNILPVLPNPVCTSPATNSAPWRWQSSHALLRYPAGGTTMPPPPWIGSTMNAAAGSS